MSLVKEEGSVKGVARELMRVVHPTLERLNIVESPRELSAIWSLFWSSLDIAGLLMPGGGGQTETMIPTMWWNSNFN